MYYIRLFLLLLPYFFTGLLFTFVAIIIEKYLISIGWVQGNTIFLAIAVFCFFTILELIKFPASISIGWIEIFWLLMMPLSVNRYDLSTTMSKGRWWWRSNHDEKKIK